MPTLWIVGGPNGSGKSTIIRSFARYKDFLSVDTDRAARELNPEDPVRAQIEAARQSINLFREYFSKGLSFIAETTLAGNGPLKLMLDAKKLGYRVNITYIALNAVEIHIERVRMRFQLGEHDVPEIDIRRRYARSLAQAPFALKLADEGEVFDNSDSTPSKLLLTEHGRVTWRPASLPGWAARIEEQLKD